MSQNEAFHRQKGHELLHYYGASRISISPTVAELCFLHRSLPDFLYLQGMDWRTLLAVALLTENRRISRCENPIVDSFVF